MARSLACGSAVQDAVAAVLRSGKPMDGIETVIARAGGRPLVCLVNIAPLRDEAGVVIGTMNILTDVSDRRRAEQAVQLLNDTFERRIEDARAEMSKAFDRLRESEHRFRLLVDGVIDYAIYMLDPDGYVTNWNSGAQRIKGYSASDIVGQHFSRFYGENDRAAGVPVRALGHRAANRKVRRRGLARAQGRHHFLGERRHRCDP